MKLQLSANDYIDIDNYLEETDDVQISCGLIQDNGITISLNQSFRMPFNEIFKLLGYNTSRVKYDLIEYFETNDIFLRVWKYRNTDTIFSFIEKNSKKDIAFSSNLADIIQSEVYKKGKNTNL